MPTKREVIIAVGSFSAGVTVPKVVPKMKFVKGVKFWKEVLQTWLRLQKICTEEYYRIDEAIEAETKFLAMINPNNRYTQFTDISFEVTDDGKNRGIRLNVKNDKKKDEG